MTDKDFKPPRASKSKQSLLELKESTRKRKAEAEKPICIEEQATVQQLIQTTEERVMRRLDAIEVSIGRLLDMCLQAEPDEFSEGETTLKKR